MVDPRLAIDPVVSEVIGDLFLVSVEDGEEEVRSAAGLDSG